MKIEYPKRKISIFCYKLCFLMAMIGLGFAIWGGILYFQNKESSLIPSLAFGVFSVLVGGSIHELTKNLDKGYSLKGETLIIINSAGELVEYDLKEVSKYIKQFFYRELIIKNKKIYITKDYSNHAELFAKLDLICEEKRPKGE